MRKLNIKISKKQLVFTCLGVISVLVALFLSICSNNMLNKLDHEQMAKRWSEKKDCAQISCFFSPSASMTQEQFMQFEYTLNKKLTEESIVNDSENPSARLWADAYSANGKVSIEYNKKYVDVNAIGIGGDFFLFHPLKLLYGSYFSGHDLMSDHIVIDENIAWQLFGSNDVAGKIVYIGNVPHMIAGVIERDDSKMAENAGLNSSVVYLSYDSLNKYGSNYGINCYEIVMPNPIKGFAKTFVTENIGVTENDVEVVENTSRYGFLNLWKILMQFGTRSMNSKAIIYPYWENMARGYEDYAVLLLVFILLFYAFPAILILILVIWYWKHKTWTIGSVLKRILDKWEDNSCKRYQKRKKKRLEKQRKKELEILDLEEENYEEDDEKNN